jgi:DNA-binding transcriptional regulator YiaG
MSENNIKKLREDMGMSIDDLAPIMETTKRKIQSFECPPHLVSYRRPPVRYTKLLTMFHRFGIPEDFK